MGVMVAHLKEIDHPAVHCLRPPRPPPDHHPSFWIFRPLSSDTSLISLCHVCLENPASSDHSSSRGTSEHLTKSTSNLANIQTTKNSLDSPRTGLSSDALVSPSTCFPAPSTGLLPVLVRSVFLWPSLALEGDSW
ncbi:hypothetical protein E2C01_040454 [Portunus trituberculatus]|uniref:Uncharacterized protein n=1 Tax=Portunus trituberculatus TaxID=210409 RepID=A0A5B7FP90_PORTR|nr:hypothetical protein [Portunus trituberculatus]